jgi:hypothetical protein
MKEYGKNMLIVSTYWGEAKSFKLIPVTNDCPYLEVMYDSTTGLLAVISKSKKQVFHNVPKIDDNGDMIYMKMGKRENGKNYKEERRTIETFQEYYLIEESEIIDFVNTFGVNSEEFNYMVYVEATRKKSNPDIVMPEVAPIMSLDGEVLTK